MLCCWTFYSWDVSKKMASECLHCVPSISKSHYLKKKIIYIDIYINMKIFVFFHFFPFHFIFYIQWNRTFQITTQELINILTEGIADAAKNKNKNLQHYKKRLREPGGPSKEKHASSIHLVCIVVCMFITLKQTFPLLFLKAWCHVNPRLWPNCWGGKRRTAFSWSR